MTQARDTVAAPTGRVGEISAAGPGAIAGDPHMPLIDPRGMPGVRIGPRTPLRQTPGSVRPAHAHPRAPADGRRSPSSR